MSKGAVESNGCLRKIASFEGRNILSFYFENLLLQSPPPLTTPMVGYLFKSFLRRRSAVLRLL